MNLGIAFQLVDDALDYGGKAAKLGKNIGDDFREGKITLPVVLAYRRGSDGEREFWRYQHLVADDVAVPIVHGLEPVEVGGRSCGETQPAQHTLKQVRRKLCCSCRHLHSSLLYKGFCPNIWPVCTDACVGYWKAAACFQDTNAARDLALGASQTP